MKYYFNIVINLHISSENFEVIKTFYLNYYKNYISYT